MPEMTWRKAIEKAISEAPGAIHYRDLTDKIITDGLRTNLGATVFVLLPLREKVAAVGGRMRGRAGLSGEPS